jgi:hypothetical protein
MPFLLHIILERFQIFQNEQLSLFIQLMWGVGRGVAGLYKIYNDI